MSALDLGQLISRPRRERPQLWGPAVCTSDLVLIYGDTGLGKSQFGGKLAHTMATGGRFLAYECANLQKVLYVDGEMGLDLMAERLEKVDAAAPHGAYPTSFYVITPETCDLPNGRVWNMATTQGQKLYEKELARTGASVIFIDNILSCLYEIDQSDNDFRIWARTEPWIVDLRKRGFTVILFHHTGKSGDQLGTSTRKKAMNTVIKLARPTSRREDLPGAEFEIHFEKTRNALACDTRPLYVTYLRQDDGSSVWGWDYLKQTTERSIRDLKASGASPREAARQLRMDYVEIMKRWNDDDDTNF